MPLGSRGCLLPPISPQSPAAFAPAPCSRLSKALRLKRHRPAQPSAWFGEEVTPPRTRSNPTPRTRGRSLCPPRCRRVWLRSCPAASGAGSARVPGAQRVPPHVRSLQRGLRLLPERSLGEEPTELQSLFPDT